MVISTVIVAIVVRNFRKSRKKSSEKWQQLINRLRVFSSNKRQPKPEASFDFTEVEFLGI